MMSDTKRRYRAFISYSHGDRSKAVWLHRNLESFTSSAVGDKTRPLKPVFLDRHELPAASNLSLELKTALDQSERLIILCSPFAARSSWIDQEVAYFLIDRSLDDIVCVIVGGDRTAPFRALQPMSLARALGSDREPLAADLRPGQDGKRLVVLKVAAALLGRRLSDLLQRDVRRRIRMLVAVTVMTATLALVMGGLAVVAWRSRQDARHQYAESESLIAYMMDDLAGELEPVGRLDILDGVGAQVLRHYERNPPQGDDDALRKRARALGLVAKVRDKRGDLSGARSAFEMAAATSSRRLQNRPADGDRLFDHAQNVFWLAYTSWRLGEAGPAEAGFREYLDLARALVQRDPDRADWRLEPAYAQSNLGTLLFEQGRTGESLTAFSAARAVFADAWTVAPADPARLVDLADADAWVADALVRLGRLRDALTARRQSADRLMRYAAAHPEDRPMAARAWAAQSALCRRELDLGLPGARARAIAARDALATLSAFDPANTTWREYRVQSEMDLVDLALAAGDANDAAEASQRVTRHLRALRATNPDVVFWRTSLEWRSRKQGLLTPTGLGRKAAALDLLARTATNEGDQGERTSARAAAFAALGRWGEVVRTLKDGGQRVLPADRSLLARALQKEGDARAGAEILRQLGDAGYVPPRITA